jgi:hypothetical protein
MTPPEWFRPTADYISGYRFDANLWDPALPPAAAAQLASEMHPKSS